MTTPYFKDSQSTGSTYKTRLIAGTGLAIIVSSMIHLWLGSDIALIGVMSSVSCLGLAFLLPKRISYSNIFVFLLSVYSGLAALILKALLGQTLQTNLFAATESAQYLFIGFTSIAACAILAKFSLQGRVASIGRLMNRPDFAKQALVGLIFFGVATKTLHTISISSNDDSGGATGFGGFGTFNFVILLALSLLIKALKDSPSKFYKMLFYVTVTAITLLSIINNTKKGVFDFIFVLILSLYAFDIRLQLSKVTSGGIVLAFILLYASPTIHLMRSSFKTETIIERVQTFYSVISEHHFSSSELSASESDFISGFQYSYSPSGSYVYPSSANIDRFMLILPIDQVSRKLNASGEMGLPIFVTEMLEYVLPSFLIDKTPYSGVDLIAWRYGIRAPGNVARPVIGMIASSLAASGVVGVLFFPFLFLLPVFMTLDYIFGDLEGNAWGLFGVATSIFMVEREFEIMLPYLLRDIPIILIFANICLLLAKKRKS